MEAYTLTTPGRQVPRGEGGHSPEGHRLLRPHGHGFPEQDERDEVCTKCMKWVGISNSNELRFLGTCNCSCTYYFPFLSEFTISFIFSLTLGQDSTFFRGILDKMQSKGLGTRATLYVPRTVLEALGLHLIQRSRGKGWRLDIIHAVWFIRNTSKFPIRLFLNFS